MESEILVSVIMITYGHEMYIKEAIDGVLMQECDFKLELIIANDNSPDNTDNVVKEIIRSHPRGNSIKYTCHEANIGAQVNFNWAASQATGKYIALCEGDDYWTDPLKLQKQLDVLENTGADCCNTLWQQLTNDSKVVDCGYKHEGCDYYIEEKGNFRYYHTATRIFLKSSLEKVINYFPTELLLDTPLQIIFSEYYKVINLMDYTSVYRISGTGSWTSISLRARDRAHIDLFHKLSIWIPSKRRNFLRTKWRLKMQYIKLPKFLIEKGILVCSKLNHHYMNYRYGHIEFNPNK